MIKRYKRQLIHQAQSYQVVEDDVLWVNNKRLKRDLIIHPGVSVMIPLIKENHIMLVRQYRYGINKYLWELPAGTITEGETPLQCAKREIEEEIGYCAKTWKKIIPFYPSPGFNSEIIHSFLATNLVKSKPNFDDDEIIQTKMFSFSQIKTMIMNKKIKDGKSLAPLMYFLMDI